MNKLTKVSDNCKYCIFDSLTNLIKFSMASNSNNDINTKVLVTSNINIDLKLYG